MAYYNTTNSRSIPRPDSSAEKFTTQCIYVDSLASSGAVAIPGRPFLNSGFTVTLSKPIVLDISTRFVISLIKCEFDTRRLGNRFYDININSDLIEYQYDNNKQNQILSKVYKVKYNPAFYQTSTPFEYQAINPINRFIKSTTKVISQVSFMLDLVDYNGAVTPLPIDPTDYPTRLCFVIKAVPPNVESITII
jgi:hypothetical protein